MRFEKLTGFRETTPQEVRSKLKVAGTRMTSRVNGRTFACGALATPCLGELRERASRLPPGGRSILSEMVGDVQGLHQAKENEGALFQVASQFNLLEMVGPNVTPEMGVDIYEKDRTQGPACAIACGAGTIFRNYFVEINGQTGQSEEHQIDCLGAVGKKLGNVSAWGRFAGLAGDGSADPSLFPEVPVPMASLSTVDAGGHIRPKLSTRSLDQRMKGIGLSYVHTCSFVLFLGVAQACGDEWPHWRGPNFDGKTSESLGEVKGLREIWTAEAGIGFSSFSVAGGRAHTMGYQNGREIVWCYDAVTGAVRWSHAYPAELHPKYYEGGPGVTPTVAEDGVFVLGKQGQVFALDPLTGRVIWQRDLKAEYGVDLPTWHFAGSAYLHGDRVILNVGTAGIALDRHSGCTVWKSGPKATGYSTPVPMTDELGGRGVLGMFLGRSMTGIAAQDGRVVWTIPWKGLNATDPIVEGRDILVSSIGGSALKRLNTDGTWDTVWERKDFQNYFNPSVKIGDYLYGIDGTTHRPTRFVCLEWATGRERWREEDHTTGGLIATADYLVLCDRGEVLLARPNPGRLDIVLRQNVLPGKCWTAPVVAEGRIYARNAAGRVVCLQPLR